MMYAGTLFSRAILRRQSRKYSANNGSPCNACGARTSSDSSDGSENDGVDRLEKALFRTDR